LVKKKVGAIGRELNNPLDFVEENLYLTISEQCKLFGIGRNTYYYNPVEPKGVNQELKEEILKAYSRDPSAGSRRIAAMINRDTLLETSRAVVRRLMKQLNIKGIEPKRNLSIPKLGAQKFPYLLKNLIISRPNQVWSTDITYIKTAKGFMFLTAIIDVYSRRILSWELSNSMSKEFCIRCYTKAIESFGAPEILNTDQGSQYTSKEFIEKVLGSGALLSMDGKGRCLDNVWIERFWKTIKHNYLYLYEHKTSQELYYGISGFINFYNTERGHSSLEYFTPEEVYKTSNLIFTKIA
jgi:putative transposase